jgi:hypothetical protein
MDKILTLISNRRGWSSIFMTISLLLPVFGVTINFDPETLAEAFSNLFTAISNFLAVILPLISLFKPKK